MYIVLQMLGGWASEERLLDRLQKAAEQNLAKDPAAAESDKPAIAPAKKAIAKEEMVVDDSGEQVPEATLRAEAAALGYENHLQLFLLFGCGDTWLLC